jgi:hypothetical protein
MKKNIFLLLLLGVTHLFAQFNNLKVSSDSAYFPEEVTIAINPVNPNQVAAGANIYYFYSFEQLSNSWKEKILTSGFGVWGDPCVVYDTKGNLFFAHLSNPPSGYWIDRIVIQKSTDNGLTWSDGVGVGFNSPKNQDKEWLAVDHSNSRYRNNIYVAWTEFDKYASNNSKDSSRILFSYSEDEGETWSTPVRISDVGGNCLDKDETVEGVVPAIGVNGEIYLTWAGPKGLMFDKSLDGGKTFGKDIFITDIPGGWDFDVPGIDRCNGMPITACDISKSDYRGNIYVGWSDQRNGKDNTDIFFIKSIDNGKTWSAVKKVNNDNSSRHQFFTWMTVDSTSGNIYFIFYDRRNTTGNATDVYIARSKDGGETFQNFKISQSSFVPDKNVFFGDYINIAVYKGVIRPIWMRMDDGDLSIWSAEITDKMLDAVDVNYGELCTHAHNFYLAPNYPNPFNPTTAIEFSLPENAYVKLGVFNLLGEQVAVLNNSEMNKGNYTRTWNAENLSSGIYLVKINITGLVTGNNYSKVRKAVLIK